MFLRCKYIYENERPRLAIFTGKQVKMPELNRLFWTSDDKLKTGVKDVLLDVAGDIKSDIEELAGTEVVFKRIMFVGSLTSVNYDDESDVDLHFLVDLSDYTGKELKLVRSFFDYYARYFNNKGYTIYGHSIEIYIQDTMEDFVSPGVYDIEADEWLYGPDKDIIEVTRAERREAEGVLRRIKDLRAEFDSGSVVDIEGFRGKVRGVFDDIKKARQKGKSSKEGFLKSPENIVFKLLRRNGALDRITKLMHDARQRAMDVETED